MHPMRRSFWALAVVLGLAVMTTPTRGQMASTGLSRMTDSGIQEVVVKTRDYQFDAPDVIWSGPTHIRLLNEGPDFHHLWLVRLLEGKTVHDLMTYMAEGDKPLPAWAVDEGGPNTPGRPGEETSTYMNLKPGSYAMICVIPAATDGKIHLQHGMVRALTVKEATAASAARLPEADITMTLDDYSFGLSKMITPGHHTIRVQNQASQAHEVVVVKLAPGKSAQDFVQWVGTDRTGEEPGDILGGVTGISKGEVNVFEMDFAPGRYALLCFVPDAGDGMPHFMHGMMQEFDVGE